MAFSPGSDPSCDVLATRRPSRANTLPRVKPRAPEALGLSVRIQQPVVHADAAVKPHGMIDAGDRQVLRGDVASPCGIMAVSRRWKSET